MEERNLRYIPLISLLRYHWHIEFEENMNANYCMHLLYFLHNVDSYKFLL